MSERGTKSVKERMSESVELVGKLRELGVADSEPGLVQMRLQMNNWIRGGPAWTGRIEFPRYGRYADVILPDRAGKIASVDFKIYNTH